MKLDQVFPSKYLKASDLQGRDITVRIARIGLEELDDGKKLVLYFDGAQKGLICNRTNADRIAHYHGNDTDGWLGKEIVLFMGLVNFQGKTTEAIRVKGLPAAPQSAAAQSGVEIPL